MIRQAQRGFEMDYCVQLAFENQNAPELDGYGVDHVAVVEGLGCKAIRVREPDQIQAALQQAKAWRNKGLDCGVLAINISAFNLHAPNFYTMLEAQLKKWDYPAARLMLEITESAMMANPVSSMENLSQLADMGVQLSIDDFGTGFSSLAYLKNLPVVELKLDKSFIIQLRAGADDEVIVRSTIDLGHNLGLRVVAEGVETSAASELLKDFGCDLVQGYFYSHPLYASQLEHWLQAHS